MFAFFVAICSELVYVCCVKFVLVRKGDLTNRLPEAVNLTLLANTFRAILLQGDTSSRRG